MFPHPSIALLRFKFIAAAWNLHNFTAGKALEERQAG